MEPCCSTYNESSRYVPFDSYLCHFRGENSGPRNCEGLGLHTGRLSVLYFSLESLRMIRLCFQVGVEQLFAARPGAPARGLHGNKNRVDLFKDCRIIEFEGPTTVCFAIDVEDSQVQWVVFVRVIQAPGLKCDILVLRIPLLVEIECVEHEKLVLGIKNPAEWRFRFSIPADVK